MKKRIIALMVISLTLVVLPSTRTFAKSDNLYLPQNSIQIVELSRHGRDHGDRWRNPPPPRHRGPDRHIRSGHRPPPPPPPPRYRHRDRDNSVIWWWIINSIIIANT